MSFASISYGREAGMDDGAFVTVLVLQARRTCQAGRVANQARTGHRGRAENRGFSSGEHTLSHRRRKLWKSAGIMQDAHEEFCSSGAIRAIRTMLPTRQAGQRRKASEAGKIAA